MKTKTLYRIGPRGGLKKMGECPVNCDHVTVLGYHPDKNEAERLVWGKGRNEAERRAWVKGI